MNWKYAAAVVAITLAALVILLAMGRTPFGPTGEPGLWSSDTNSQFNSQRLADPYTFTHIAHGIGFYLLLWFLFPGLGLWQRLVLASRI